MQELSAGEVMVWLFLCELARRQGADMVIIPKTKIYTRQHLKRVLKSLEGKRYLVIMATPANHHEDLVVHVGSRKRLNIDVQVSQQGCSGRGLFPVNSGVSRTPMFSQADAPGPGGTGEKEATSAQMFSQIPIASASARDLKTKASLMKMDVREVLELNTVDLLQEVRAMEPGELMAMEQKLVGLAPLARSKKRTRVARVYAALRFLQNTAALKNPAAWVETIAKRADFELLRGRSVPGGPKRAASVPPLCRTRSG